ETAKRVFAQFQANPLQDVEGRGFYMNVLRGYRGYIDDGVETLFDSAQRGDLESFYSINRDHSNPRGDQFVKSIQDFTNYTEKVRMELEAKVASNFRTTIIASIVAVVLGILL